MTTLICNCNRTMPLDGAALIKALGPARSEGLETVHTTLCRREAGAFQRAAKSGDDLLVACTQESRLFLELNDATEGAQSVAERPIRFVNIRESGGWSKDATQALPKIAALIAAAQLPEPDPVSTVSYRSAGRVLVIGPADLAQRAAAMLADKLDVSLLLPRPGGSLPQDRLQAVHAGSLQAITGWLGAFDVSWQSGNPIDLDLCTRCNACVAACPENAIDFSYQVDLLRCTGHRECVRVCEAAGAIDFTREPQAISERFDLVLDLGASPDPSANRQPFLTLHQPPQGYFHAGDDASLMRAVLQLREMTGEFEKPKFFDYRQKLCAHSRNEQIGCSACIDVCSAQAIVSEAKSEGKSGGGIRIEPHLCVGCGACTTVCPSGALGYTTPRADDLGRRLRTMVSTFLKAGGRDPVLLLHSQQAGARLIGDLGRLASTNTGVHGVPARVMPVDVWHTASVGIDLWLAAIAFGASQVWVLMTDEEAPDYRQAVAEQMAVAQAILAGLGYAGEHLRIVSATDARGLDAALKRPAAKGVAQAGSFSVQADKRATLDLALDHLLAQSRHPADVTAVPIPLPAASLFGSITVDTDACTLCLACVGACPEGALADNADKPQLRFIEKNCVQCGLCESTCPENAITLEPRLWLADGGKARKQPRVVAEMEPYACVRCGKPFGTLRAIEAMVVKLAGHSMFQGVAAERLKMCSDCRVIDIHRNANEVRITDL